MRTHWNGAAFTHRRTRPGMCAGFASHELVVFAMRHFDGAERVGDAVLGPLQCRAAGCRPSLQAMLTAHSRRGRCASAYCQPMQSIQRRLTRMQTTQSSVDFVLAYVCRCVLMQTTHPALRVRNAVAACHGFRPLAMVRCGSSWQRRAHCDVRANDLADARGVLLGERRVPARCQPAPRPSMLRCRTASGLRSGAPRRVDLLPEVKAEMAD